MEPSPGNAFESELAQSGQLVVAQRRELGELFGFETRNKYEILDGRGGRVGYAAEQQKGFWGFLFRQAVGHWRTFDVTFFDEQRQPVMKAHHPFRWIFQRFEIADADGRPLGSLQRRFAIFSKIFDLEDASGRVLLTVRSPLWRPWTFEFERAGQTAAAVRKKWSGLLREAFLDADNFQVDFSPGPVSLVERKLLLAAAVFIDLNYFENKSGS